MGQGFFQGMVWVILLYLRVTPFNVFVFFFLV
jgi:hypothetical protein